MPVHKGQFVQQQHKPPQERTREIIVACEVTPTNFNRIVRTASCCGVKKIIGTNAKIIKKVSRNFSGDVEVKSCRTLLPVLKKLKEQGYTLVALEQTTNSHTLYDFYFDEKSVLVIGNERTGLSQKVLDIVDETVEIPMFGMPFSHNAAIATGMALFQYCKQFDFDEPGGILDLHDGDTPMSFSELADKICDKKEN
jgi:tRNA G18 (ribose-2'-O)-methylase SpoU